MAKKKTSAKKTTKKNAATKAKGTRAAKKKATKSPKAAGTKNPSRKKKDGHMGVLDAAAKVLAENGEPMSCQEMIDEMLAKGYWQTCGKTPASTLYAALFRQIKKNGKEARFKKVDRGKFALNK